MGNAAQKRATQNYRTRLTQRGFTRLGPDKSLRAFPQWNHPAPKQRGRIRHPMEKNHVLHFINLVASQSPRRVR